MIIVPINAIEMDGTEPVIHLNSDWANEDWIRARRLLKAGKRAELRRRENTPMNKVIGINTYEKDE